MGWGSVYTVVYMCTPQEGASSTPSPTLSLPKDMHSLHHFGACHRRACLLRLYRHGAWPRRSAIHTAADVELARSGVLSTTPPT